MERISLLLLLMTLAVLPAFSQENRYVVYFDDKANTPFSLENPDQFLSPRSVLRRDRQQISVTTQDLPVDPEYIQQVRSVTGQTYYPSKWLNAVLVQCTPEEAALAESLPIVTGIELVAYGTRLPEGGRIQRKFESAEGVMAPENEFQLNLHGINDLHNAGFRGEDMMVAVMDGGFGGADTITGLRHIYEEGRVLISENMVTRSTEQFTLAHGTNVLSILAGWLPDRYQGIVPQATYLLFGTEDPFTEQRIEEYNWIVAAEKADSAGVDVINTSLGYSDFDFEEMNYTYEDMNGSTAMITRGANWASSKGILVVVSAGNSGSSSWKYITAPADAVDILSVGAATVSLTPASFSSFGPSFDGRIKPEVASLGSQTVLLSSSGNITASNGTSFSAPVITGFATALWQRERSRTVTDLISYIISISTLSDSPDSQLGYGFPSVAEEVTSSEEEEQVLIAYPNPLAAGQQLRIRVGVPVTGSRLYTSDGREIPVRYREEGGEFVLENRLDEGLYLLTIRTAVRTYHTKIISN